MGVPSAARCPHSLPWPHLCISLIPPIASYCSDVRKPQLICQVQVTAAYAWYWSAGSPSCHVPSFLPRGKTGDISIRRWLLSWIADPELGLDEIDQREWERKNLFLIPRTSAARGKSASTGTAAVAAVAATSGKATLVAGGRHHSQHHNYPGRSTSLPSYVNRLSSAKAAVRPQPPGSYGSYGRIGKSLVPALEPPIERQEEEDAAAAQVHPCTFPHAVEQFV